MNDIEKKIEELKSEFLTKLETLQKEVKMQKYISVTKKLSGNDFSNFRRSFTKKKIMI